MRIRSLVPPLIVAIVVAGLALALRTRAPQTTSSSQAPVTVTAGHVTIAIRNYAFAPKALTVKIGTRVTWTNHDATAHTATADQTSFDTGTLNTNQSRTIDFKRPGTYTYHCAFHAFMTSAITVTR